MSTASAASGHLMRAGVVLCLATFADLTAQPASPDKAPSPRSTFPLMEPLPASAGTNQAPYLPPPNAAAPWPHLKRSQVATNMAVGSATRSLFSSSLAAAKTPQSPLVWDA